MMRIALAAVGFVSVFVISPWVTFLVALLLSLRWRAWEVIAMGFFVDALWLPSTAFFGIPFATLIGVALVWFLEPFRNELLLGRSA